MNVAGLKGDPAYPKSFGNLNKPLPIELAGEKLAKAFNKLGWHWWPSYSAISTKKNKFQKSLLNLIIIIYYILIPLNLVLIIHTSN